MITLTRLSGSQFVLNADLIERVDNTPDTVITLVDGTKYVVSESVGGVLDAVVAYRGEIVALASLLDTAHAYAQGLQPEVPYSRGGEPKLASIGAYPRAVGNTGRARKPGDSR